MKVASSRGWLVGLAVLAAMLCAACEPCLGRGRNGVPDPEADQFQLVFSNIVSRETPLYVDGKKVGTVCDETEYATVGNFPVDTHTRLKLHNLISDLDCSISPNCSTDCDAQVCEAEPVIDTTPFAGRIFSTGFIWRQ